MGFCGPCHATKQNYQRRALRTYVALKKQSHVRPRTYVDSTMGRYVRTYPDVRQGCVRACVLTYVRARRASQGQETTDARPVVPAAPGRVRAYVRFLSGRT